MIVELRTYVLHPGRQAEFLRLMGEEGIAIERPILGRMLGFYTSEIGPLNQLVHLWGYDSLADYEARCRARDADPGMAEYFKATVGMIAEQETRLIRRVELASLKAL